MIELALELIEETDVVGHVDPCPTVDGRHAPSASIRTPAVATTDVAWPTNGYFRPSSKRPGVLLLVGDEQDGKHEAT